MYQCCVLTCRFSSFFVFLGGLQDDEKTRGLYDVSVIEMLSLRNVGCALIPIITQLNLVHNDPMLVLITCCFGAF